MSLATVLMVMLALVALVERKGVLSRVLDGGQLALTLRDDMAIVPRGVSTSIDVLENDSALGEEDGKRLIVVSQPACGKVIAMAGKARYLPEPECVGLQRFRYGLYDRGYGAEADATLILRIADPIPGEVMAEATRDDQPVGQTASRWAEPTRAVAVLQRVGALSGAIPLLPVAAAQPRHPAVAVAQTRAPALFQTDAFARDIASHAPDIREPVAGLGEVAPVAPRPMISQPDLAYGPEVPGPLAERRSLPRL